MNALKAARATLQTITSAELTVGFLTDDKIVFFVGLIGFLFVFLAALTEDEETSEQ